ncbi:MAG: hypothetical protein L3J07_00200 [Candidatus Magasanikbacteria bacterium]|nr:hypothetical protein [Candidatus Magasanikbacteria bacterium]
MIGDEFKKMRKILKRLNSFCVKRRHLISKFGVFLFVATIGVFLIINPVFAQSATESVANFFIEGAARMFLVLANFFMALTIFALRYFVEIAAYNNHTLADTVVLGWTMVRDVSNMFFVVILLAIAFGTILGLDQYEWKKLTVKLILAAIFINFSKLIAGIIIDAAHVFTITFLNAIVATAGGNIINMFKLGDMMTFAGSAMDNPSEGDLLLKVLGGSVAAFLFSFVALLTIGAYAVVMLSRMLVLWVLIILSPLAYLMSVLPATKKYADEYWKEFIKYVIAGPVMVFFLWLAFATMGSGNINQEVASNVSVEGAAISDQAPSSGSRESEISASLSAVTEWESMASFFIAVAFLFVGLQQVSKLGLVGGTLAGQATGLGTKWAMIATGAAAAGYLGAKVAQVPGVVAKKVPLVGTEALARYGKGLKGRFDKTKGGFDLWRGRGTDNLRGALKSTDNDSGGVKVGKFIGRLGLGTLGHIIEPKFRKEARAQKWEDTSEAMKEKLKLYSKASESSGGQALSKIQGEIEVKTAVKEQGKVQKKAELHQKRMEGANKEDIRYKDLVEQKYRKEEEKEKAVSSATAVEAELLGERGLKAEAANLDAKRLYEQRQESQKQFSYMDYPAKIAVAQELTNQAQSTRDQITKLKSENSTANKKEIENLGHVLDKAIRDSASVRASLLSEGSETGAAGLAATLAIIDPEVKGDFTGPSGEIRKEQTSILGRVVKKGEEAAAQVEIEKAYGGAKNAQGTFRNLSAAYTSAGMDGGFNKMGLIGSRIDKRGKLVYSFGQQAVERDKNEEILIYLNPKDKSLGQISSGIKDINKLTPSQQKQVNKLNKLEMTQDMNASKYAAGRVGIQKLNSLDGFVQKDASGTVKSLSETDKRNFRDIIRGKNAFSIEHIPEAFFAELRSFKESVRKNIIDIAEKELTNPDAKKLFETRAQPK